ncbi:MAG: hypothetical protein ACLFR8_03670 [Alkalispirochaeta sp.]
MFSKRLAIVVAIILVLGGIVGADGRSTGRATLELRGFVHSHTDIAVDAPGDVVSRDDHDAGYRVVATVRAATNAVGGVSLSLRCGSAGTVRVNDEQRSFVDGRVGLGAIRNCAGRDRASMEIAVDSMVDLEEVIVLEVAAN